jgi:hypothetical protein
MAMTMEAASTYEKPVNFYWTTQLYHPEGSHLHGHGGDSLRPTKMNFRNL